MVTKCSTWNKPWFVYFVRCADDSLYCGITNDLEARVKAHNQGKGSKYVGSRLPAVLVWSAPCKDRAAASRREYRLKRFSKTEKESIVRYGLTKRILSAIKQ